MYAVFASSTSSVLCSPRDAAELEPTAAVRSAFVISPSPFSPRPPPGAQTARGHGLSRNPTSALLEAGGRLPVLSVIGVVLSWIVIAVWWASAMVAALLIPSLMIVAGFAALVVAGNAWTQQHGGESAVTRRGQWLALVGHLFLVFVASQPSLAIPPWPLFGVLALLDLAVGRRLSTPGAPEHAARCVRLNSCSRGGSGRKRRDLDMTRWPPRSRSPRSRSLGPLGPPPRRGGRRLLGTAATHVSSTRSS